MCDCKSNIKETKQSPVLIDPMDNTCRARESETFGLLFGTQKMNGLSVKQPSIANGLQPALNKLYNPYAR